MIRLPCERALIDLQIVALDKDSIGRQKAVHLDLGIVLYGASPTFTLPNPTSSNNAAKMKEVPTFAALRQFRVAEQVTCHNSGKSL
ncbi:hypothetical protein FQN60_005732 [Etheostoma spectabile]|uniref:Uncharacterized protein n=1 Tax=Etheostoma spectabile TaxID=54343 RepID=A0A5J5CEL4_9PERO|nr:hypothetical protein FQN60_005732 [Etheostoma spectabile]